MTFQLFILVTLAVNLWNRFRVLWFLQLQNTKIISLLLFRASINVDTFEITLHINLDYDKILHKHVAVDT